MSDFAYFGQQLLNFGGTLAEIGNRRIETEARSILSRSDRHIRKKIQDFNNELESNPNYQEYDKLWGESSTDLLQESLDGINNHLARKYVEERFAELNLQQTNAINKLKIKRQRDNIFNLEMNNVADIVADQSLSPVERTRQIQATYDGLVSENIMDSEKAKAEAEGVVRGMLSGWYQSEALKRLRQGASMEDVVRDLYEAQTKDENGNAMITLHGEPIFLSNEKKNEIVGAVRREWNILQSIKEEEMRKADNKLSKQFEDGYTKALNEGSKAGLHLLLDKLESTEWHDSGQKYTWDTRLRNALNAIGGKGDPAWMENRRDLLMDLVEKARSGMTDSEYYAAVQDARPYMEDDREYEKFYNLRKRDDSGIKAAFEIIESLGGDQRDAVPDEKLAQLKVKLNDYWLRNPTAEPEDIVNFANGIKQGYVAEIFDRVGKHGARDYRRTDAAEQYLIALKKGHLSYANEAEYQEIMSLLGKNDFEGTLSATEAQFTKLATEKFNNDFSYEIGKLEGTTRVRPEFRESGYGETGLIPIFRVEQTLANGSVVKRQDLAFAMHQVDEEEKLRMERYAGQKRQSGDWSDAEYSRFLENLKVGTEGWYRWDPETIDPFSGKRGTWVYYHEVGTRTSPVEDVITGRDEEKVREDFYDAMDQKKDMLDTAGVPGVPQEKEEDPETQYGNYRTRRFW